MGPRFPHTTLRKGLHGGHVCEREMGCFLKPPERQRIKKVLLMNGCFWLGALVSLLGLCEICGGGVVFLGQMVRKERKGSERDRDAERNRDSWVQMGTSFWLSLTLSVCFLGIAKGGKR